MVAGLSSEFDIVTAPTDPVVSMSELHDHLEYLETDLDVMIAGLERMAVERVEIETRRQLLTASWILYLPFFPTVLPIRKAPLASVTQIRYVDTGGDWQVLSSSVYESFLTRQPAEIHLAYSQSWPATRAKEQAVEVTFVAGYGDPEDVPDIAKQAIKLIVQDQFNSCDKNESTIERLLSQLEWGL